MFLGIPWFCHVQFPWFLNSQLKKVWINLSCCCFKNVLSTVVQVPCCAQMEANVAVTPNMRLFYSANKRPWKDYCHLVFWRLAAKLDRFGLASKKWTRLRSQNRDFQHEARDHYWKKEKKTNKQKFASVQKEFLINNKLTNTTKKQIWKSHILKICPGTIQFLELFFCTIAPRNVTHFRARKRAFLTCLLVCRWGFPAKWPKYSFSTLFPASGHCSTGGARKTKSHPYRSWTGQLPIQEQAWLVRCGIFLHHTGLFPLHFLFADDFWVNR